MLLTYFGSVLNALSGISAFLGMSVWVTNTEADFGWLYDNTNLSWSPVVGVELDLHYFVLILDMA